jgi:AcrR family transcriptional regulator
MPRPSDPFARSRLLAAAEAVFLEKGLDRAKVEDITQLATLSKGAFYLHFKSKEAAFREVLSSALAAIGESLDRMSESRGLWSTMSSEELIAFWYSHDLELFEYLWERRALMRLVLQGGGSPDYAHLTELFVARAEAVVGLFVEHGILSGHFHELFNTNYVATFMAGGWDRVARRIILEDAPPDLPRWIAQAQHFCLRSLSTPQFLSAANSFYSKVCGPDANLGPSRPITSDHALYPHLTQASS